MSLKKQNVFALEVKNEIDEIKVQMKEKDNDDEVDELNKDLEKL